MPDQPNDTPPQPGPDGQPTEIAASSDAADSQPTTVFAEPVAAESKESWANKPLHVTRAVATGTAAGILLVGGVAGLAIGATLAGNDSDDHGPGRIGWHVERGDRSDRGDRDQMPERGNGDWREQAPPDFGQGGPDFSNPGPPEGDYPAPEDNEPTPTDPSDSGTDS